MHLLEVGGMRCRRVVVLRKRGRVGRKSRMGCVWGLERNALFQYE